MYSPGKLSECGSVCPNVSKTLHHRNDKARVLQYLRDTYRHACGRCRSRQEYRADCSKV